MVIIKNIAINQAIQPIAKCKKQNQALKNRLRRLGVVPRSSLHYFSGLGVLLHYADRIAPTKFMPNPF